MSFHTNAPKAAEAAECAGEQGQYWPMHDLLFGRQDEWSSAQDPVQKFKAFAGELKLDQAQFDACLDGGKFAQKVNADLQEGAQQGVSGTPAFFVNGSLLSGAQPYANFRQYVDYYLAGGETPQREVAADSYRSLGQASAPVVITEYSDFQ